MTGAFLNRKTYRLPTQVLYNNLNTNNVYGIVAYPNIVSMVAGYKRILKGTIWANDNRLLQRARLLAPYAAGDNVIHTNNPYVFFPGDILYEIGDATEDSVAERNRIEQATAQVLGTIISIEAQRQSLTYEITPATPAIGDVFTLKVGTDFVGQNYSFTADTTDVADVTKGLAEAITDRRFSHHSIANCLKVTEDGTKITIVSDEPGEIFTIVPSVVGTTGTITQEVTQGVGAITIAPDAGNSNNVIGAKIGKINQVPMGIVAHDYYLTDDDARDRAVDIAPYDVANVYKEALNYVDGQVVSSLPTVKLIPPYALAA